jgi:hypothetical protein
VEQNNVCSLLLINTSAVGWNKSYLCIAGCTGCIMSTAIINLSGRIVLTLVVLKIKVKVKLSSSRHDDMQGSRGMAPLIRSFGTRWR